MRRWEFADAGILLLAILVVAGWPQVGLAEVSVRATPSAKTVNVGQPFDMQLRADIGDPVLGWGLDVTFDGDIIGQALAPTIGPLWASVHTPDGDGLAGLKFPPSISGNDILLATLHFVAIAPGQTDLVIGVTAGDLTEGFALDPTGFASLHFEPASVTVVPEPASGLLLAGCVMWLRRRWRG